MNVKGMVSETSTSNMREMLKECLFELQTKAENSHLPGISSGFETLDEFTGGLEKGKVYVIGGRPCMGKEEFMLSMIRDIIMESKLPVLLFSTNYKKMDYVLRLLSMHCDMETSHLHHGFLESHEWERLDKRVGTLAEVPLFIHDSLELPLEELTETARNCIREKGARIIFIDCLQMIDFAKGGDTPSERTGKVMCSLKQLACLMDIPVVVGSMLSRCIDYREGAEGKQPQLMDLANSSYIEEIADVVMMVHRPEYYHIYQDEQGRDLHGLMQIMVKKNGLKPLSSILLDYHQDTGIVSLRKEITKPASKPISLEELHTDNKAVKNLIQTFELEEELPF